MGGGDGGGAEKGIKNPLPKSDQFDIYKKSSPFYGQEHF